MANIQTSNAGQSGNAGTESNWSKFRKKFGGFFIWFFKLFKTNPNSETIHCLEFKTKEDEKIYSLIIKLEIYLIPILILTAGITTLLFFKSLDTTGVRISLVVIAIISFVAKILFLIEENPADNVMMITLFGKPVAYARKGGPFPKSTICKIYQIKRQNMVIKFGEKEGAENEIAVSCATPEQAVANKEEFIKMFNGEGAKGKPFKPEVSAEEAYEACIKDVNHTQVLFKPGINLVFRIGSKEGFANGEDQGLENIRRFFINIPGDTIEAKKGFIESVVRENIRAQFNTQFKKFTYSMLSMLMTTDILDRIMKQQVISTCQKQRLGIEIISFKLTGLNAGEDIHNEQVSLARSKIAKSKTEVEAKASAKASKIKTAADAENTKKVAEANKEKLILDGQGAANALVEKGKADAKNAKAIGLAEMEVLEKTLEKLKIQAGDDNDILKRIIELEYELEIAKQYVQAKGPVIIKDHGGSQKSGDNDTTTQTVLLIEAIKQLGEKIGKN